MVWVVGTAARAAVISVHVALMACAGLLVGLTLGPALLSVTGAAAPPETLSPESAVVGVGVSVGQSPGDLLGGLRTRYATLDATLDRILR